MYLKEKKLNFNPLVSVIVTCYNYEKYISTSIESVLNQTYKNIEIIVVDDGSTDLSEKVIEKYIDKIKYIKQKNSGVSVARNNGIKKSNGTWVLSLDADDWINPHYIEDALKHIKDYKSVICARYFFTDENLNYIEKTYPEGNINLNNCKLENIIQDNYITQTSLYSKKMWNKCGGYNEQLKRAEDWEFNVNMVSRGASVYYIEEREPYLKYRYHEHGKSIKNLKYYKHTQRYIKKKYSIEEIN